MTQTSHPHAGQLFALDTARHAMTIAHDDGVYRHLKFRAPDTSLYWFDLITWPGCLTFHGDMGTYTFARLTDMIDFFKGPGDINPGYWGGKVQGNGDSRDKGVTAYSPELARSYVTESFDAWAYEQGLPLTRVRDCWDEIARQLLDNGEVEDEQTFRSAVEDFYWGGSEVYFRFRDTWDWDLSDFKHAFLYACFAVQWGVNQYLASRIESDDPDAVVVNVSRIQPPVPPRHTQRNAVVQRPSAKQLATLQPREEFL